MRVRPLVLAAAGIASAVLLAGCASSSSSGGTASGHSMGDGSMMSGPSMTATASPSTVASGTPAPGGGNAADIAFAQSMIPHHEQAVQMADLALADGSGASKQVRALAEQIKAAQDPEIQQMTGWLGEWGAPTSMPSDSAMGGMDMGGMDMTGMMSNEDMAALAHAHGAEFDRMWLQMMIVHHQGAVSMAQQVLTTTANPQVQAMAQAVIDGQTAEIDQMKGMLAS